MHAYLIAAPSMSDSIPPESFFDAGQSITHLFAATLLWWWYAIFAIAASHSPSSTFNFFSPSKSILYCKPQRRWRGCHPSPLFCPPFISCSAKAKALFQACQVHADTNKLFDVWPNRPKIHGKILKRNCMCLPGKMKTRHFHSFWVCGFLWISTFVAAVEWQKMYKGFSQIKMKIHKFVGVGKEKFEMEKWPFTLSNDTHYRCQFTFQIMEFQTHFYWPISQFAQCFNEHRMKIQ